MDTHNVEIELNKNGGKGSIIIDDQEIKDIHEIKFEAKAGSPPILWIKLSPIYNVKIKPTNTEIRAILSYEKGASK